MSASRSQRLGMYWFTVCLSALATFASAQTSNTVLLEAPDKSVSLSGELIEASNGQYKLSTIAGVLSIDVDAVNCLGDTCPLVVPVFEPGAEVTLSSADGEVNVTGNITDIVEGQYVVDSGVQDNFRIGVDLVDCAGPGCPTGLRFVDDSAGIAVAAQELTSGTLTAEVESGSTAPEDVSESTEPETVSETTAPEAVSETAATDDVSEAVADAGSVQYDPADARITFAGSDTVGLGLLPYLLEDYADVLNATAETRRVSESETAVRYIGPDESEMFSVYVDATGSGDAVNALETKSAVFGMTSRPIDNDEALRLSAVGVGDLRNSDNETVIAVDSLAVITHSSNPVTSISMAEIAAIYVGAIDNWSQVGGPDAPITVLSRDDGSSTRGVFENAIFGGEAVTLAERVVYPGGDNPEMAAAVKGDPLAIGYVGFAYSEGLQRLDLTSECGITHTATPFAVKTEEYPLGRRLYLYNRVDNTPEEAERFLNYVLSPDSDDAIAQSSFVNFAVERSPQSKSRFDRLFEGVLSESGLRLTNQMLKELILWDRLSTTVRFRIGSSTLDRKELNDISRLISKLGELPQGTRVAVVGFTDDVGSFEYNQALSERRAETVADAITSMAGDLSSRFQIETLAYSELSPAVCNSDANSRAINRRVEIWVHR